mmetsp:Transcript_11483/g.37753  ORF Transcript_11483/g.37753 Transcript_11483/m.37753 type:complete len:269 (+) Transcript_11483:2208-3014(+)
MTSLERAVETLCAPARATPAEQLSALRSLSQSGRASRVLEQVLPSLAELLGEEDDSVAAAAALALHQVPGTDVKLCARVVSEPGVVPGLITLMTRVDAPEAVEQAVQTLWQLSRAHVPVHEALAEQGVVELLVRVIGSPAMTAGGKEWAVSLLRTLTDYSVASVERAKAAGAREVLAALISTTTTFSMRESAEAAMNNLKEPPQQHTPVGPIKGSTLYQPGGIGSTKSLARTAWYSLTPWQGSARTHGIGGRSEPWCVKDHHGRVLQG